MVLGKEAWRQRERGRDAALDLGFHICENGLPLSFPRWVQKTAVPCRSRCVASFPSHAQGLLALAMGPVSAPEQGIHLIHLQDLASFTSELSCRQ